MDRRGFLRRASATAVAPLAAGVTWPATTAAAAVTAALPSRAAILASMKLVNDYWINTHPDPGTNLWDRATYYSGAMCHYRVTRDPRYLDYTRRWAESHSYSLNGGVTTRNADNHCAGQAYLDLYEELGGAHRIAAIEESLNLMNQSTRRDDWWWCDALHMAMPPFARLGKLRGDAKYWVTLYQLYHHTKRLRLDKQNRVTGLYSEHTPLWHRDNNYVIDAPNQSTPNGEPMFWSRGNGWVIAGHAKTLMALPHTDKRGPEYIHTLQQMSAHLRRIQRADGFWNVSLADPAHYGGPETSGTAFFTFGMAYGINAGLLDRDTYLPVVAQAWNGMNEIAVRSDGFLGYVQAIAGAPGPVDPNHTTDYAVGGFLMAGAELAALAV